MVFHGGAGGEITPLFFFSIAIVTMVGFMISIRLLEFSCLFTLIRRWAGSMRALLQGLAFRGLAFRGLVRGFTSGMFM